mmetsp:Transcript_3485/g.5123  ORF Transcript_3485/g.5123 Transcript_3485/m.5123 type:complete len:147 (+) Transcript_3485:13-453(+)
MNIFSTFFGTNDDNLDRDPYNHNLNQHVRQGSRPNSSRRRIMEGLIVSALGIIFWLISLYRRKKSLNNLPQTGNSSSNSTVFGFLQDFLANGGLSSVFPGDDVRDTSVQFELISQINGTTSVGKPISLTVRNTPQDRRRMRLFGGY